MFPKEPTFVKHKSTGRVMEVKRIIAKGNKADEQEVGYGWQWYGDLLCEFSLEGGEKAVREWFKPKEVDDCQQDGSVLPAKPKTKSK